MTNEPKALVVPPMPNEHRVPAMIEDLKAWGAQAWEIAQAQAQRADELQATLANRGSVYVTDGHGALWGTAESITWVTDELDRLESTIAQRDREVLALRSALENTREWCRNERAICRIVELALTSTADAADDAAILGAESGDLSKCPKCGGPADNGHDRCLPPSPYYCSKCTESGEAQP